MQILPLEIPDVVRVELVPHHDDRGVMVEAYNSEALKSVGIVDHFVQDNVSRSFRRGTVRGLHFQIPPRPVAKLIRVSKGSILDVAVDIRRGSPFYGMHVAVNLTADSWQALYIPPGFAHGFCTLEPDTEVSYKMTDFWVPTVDRGLLWSDPILGIEWPVDADAAILSDKDRDLPPLEELDPYFHWKES